MSFLNSSFTATVAPLTEHVAVIDKYLGDGVLVYFEGRDRAGRAVAAAAGVGRALDMFNRPRPDDAPIHTGVAVHTGEALVGTIGSPQRMEYTVIGGPVKVASRLEALNKELNAGLIFSAATVEAAGGQVRAERAAGFSLAGPNDMPIRGWDGLLEVFWAS